MRLTVLDRACLSFHQTCQSWSLQACPDVCKFYAFLSPDVLVRVKVAKACLAKLLGSRLEEASEERGKGKKEEKVAKACLATLLGSRLEGRIRGKEERGEKEEKWQTHVWQHW